MNTRFINKSVTNKIIFNMNAKTSTFYQKISLCQTRQRRQQNKSTDQYLS